MSTKTLIIAEKPSLARNIAAGIGKTDRRQGYLEGEGYIITWAFGHLFSLCDVEEYTGKDPDSRWEIDTLPCYPEQFRFRLRSDDEGIRRQFETISTLCNRDDVTKIVNAGDADREGEIIIRLCIQNALKSDKPVYRLWLPDQTPETVASALTDMKHSSEYDRLASEGFARTYVDWLYGINLTRYATLKTGVLLRVGRVIVPIVKAIYDRDMAIKNFSPEKYLGIVWSLGESELTSKHKFKAGQDAAADKLCERYNTADTVVTSKKTKKDTVKPPKLFSLSKLQNLLGKKHKMSMDMSLKTVQTLYERGYVTYPRTNSEYLATAEKGKVKKILENISALGYPVEFYDKKTVFDDSKIESHSALTPTYKIPKKSDLSDDEMLVYQTIFRRFVAVFCKEPCIAEKAELTLDVGGFEQFTLKGTVLLEAGWTKFDDAMQKDKMLPQLNKGDIIKSDFRKKEKETTPPKHYTIETLNNYLKNPFREDKAKAEDEDDAEEYRAMFEGLELGTEATRTGIIDNARKSGYIELKKDVYRILPAGEYFIEALTKMSISMDKYQTVKLGQALKKVYRGEFETSDAVNLAKQEISQVFSSKNKTGFYGDRVGVCPICKSEIAKGRYGYGCMGYKDGCKFRINDYICKRVITVDEVRELLHSGKTSKLTGFISKNGKPFDAVLKLENGSVVFEF